MGRKKPDVGLMRSVYRRCGLSDDQAQEFHDYLHSPAFDGNPNDMDFDMLVAACLDWKENNPSHDTTKPKHGQSGDYNLDDLAKRARRQRGEW